MERQIKRERERERGGERQIWTEIFPSRKELAGFSTSKNFLLWICESNFRITIKIKSNVEEVEFTYWDLFTINFKRNK